MPIGFASALAKYFGRKEGQTISEFQREISALTPKDKEELAAMLTTALGEHVEYVRPAA